MEASGTMPPQAMPAPVPPAPPGTVVHEPSAFDTIAEEFIRQYFTFLQNRPSALACFYKDSSIYTVTEAPGYVNGRAGMRPVGHNAVVVQGAAQIGAKIREHLFHDVPSEEDGHARRTSCQVKDLTWMHQVSLNGSLVLHVVGRQVNLESLQFRRFMQTFVLACEPGQSNNYFVNNDMCNYFELENPPPPMMAPAGHMHMVNGPNGPVPMAAVPPHAHGQGLVPVSPPGAKPKAAPSSPAMAAAAPAPAEKSPSGSPTFGSLESPAAPQEEQTADFQLPAPTIPPSAIPATPADEEDAKEAESAPRVEQAAQAEDKDDMAEETELADGDDSGPKVAMSWAARAALNKPPAAVPQQPSATRVARQPAAPAEEEESPQDVATKEAEDTAAPPPRKERAPYKPQESIELEASVFVSGVPQSCNEDKLKSLFGKHGDVVKVSLKAEKHFAIIDFSAPDAALDALKFPTVKCDGAILKVEKRRAGGAKPSRGTKGGEGRGGERARGRGRDSGGRGRGSHRGPREETRMQ